MSAEIIILKNHEDLSEFIMSYEGLIKRDGKKFVLYLSKPFVKDIANRRNLQDKKIPIKLSIDFNRGFCIQKSDDKTTEYFIYNNNGSFRIIFKRYDIVPLWGEEDTYPVKIYTQNNSVIVQHQSLKPNMESVYYTTKHLLLTFEDPLRRMFSKYGSKEDLNRRRSAFIRKRNRAIYRNSDKVSRSIIDMAGGIPKNNKKNEEYFDLLDTKRKSS